MGSGSTPSSSFQRWSASPGRRASDISRFFRGRMSFRITVRGCSRDILGGVQSACCGGDNKGKTHIFRWHGRWRPCEYVASIADTWRTAVPINNSLLCHGIQTWGSVIIVSSPWSAKPYWPTETVMNPPAGSSCGSLKLLAICYCANLSKVLSQP